MRNITVVYNEDGKIVEATETTSYYYNRPLPLFWHSETVMLKTTGDYMVVTLHGGLVDCVWTYHNRHSANRQYGLLDRTERTQSIKIEVK